MHCELCNKELEKDDKNFKLCAECSVTVPGNELIQKAILEVAKEMAHAECKEMMDELCAAHETIA